MKSLPVNHDKMADISPNAPVSSKHNVAPTPTATDQTAAVVTKRKQKDENFPLLSLPDRLSFFRIGSSFRSHLLVILAQISCYSAVTLRTTLFGVVTLAVH